MEYIPVWISQALMSEERRVLLNIKIKLWVNKGYWICLKASWYLAEYNTSRSVTSQSRKLIKRFIHWYTITWWLVDWKGFGREQYLPNSYIYPGNVWSYFENQSSTPGRITGITTQIRNFTSQIEVEKNSTIPTSFFRISWFHLRNKTVCCRQLYTYIVWRYTD
jgi:hypothetical protein